MDVYIDDIELPKPAFKFNLGGDRDDIGKCAAVPLSILFCNSVIIPPLLFTLLLLLPPPVLPPPVLPLLMPLNPFVLPTICAELPVTLPTIPLPLPPFELFAVFGVRR